MTTARGRAVTFLAVLTVGACGGGGVDLSSGAERVLGADVAAVTSAARAGSAAQLATALGTLRKDVAEQQAAGQLSAGRARRILAAGSRVEADVAAAPAPVPTRPVTSPTPTPRPAATRTTAPVTSSGTGSTAPHGKAKKGKGKH